MSANGRAITSTPPPAGKGTMSCIGRSGHDPCAAAIALDIAKTATTDIR
jgi:hypothetical protein